MSKLAWILLLRGRLTEAEELSREAREGQVRVLGPDHPDTAETAYNLACIASRRAQTAEAISLLGSALEHGLKPRAALRIEADSSLRALHGIGDFDALVARARQRVSSLSR